MIIIWGTKACEILLDEAPFFCHQCQSEQSFEIKKLEKYFTFFFIPIFSYRTLLEYIECTNCNAYYKAESLDEASYKKYYEQERWYDVFG